MGASPSTSPKRTKGSISYAWDVDHTPSELIEALRALSKHYPLVEGGRGRRLTFKRTSKSGAWQIIRRGDSLQIEYSRPHLAWRALGSLLSGIDCDGERCPFRMLGVMLDCSRNAVPTVGYLKGFIQRLALLGYNTLLLYTEDTYQIEEEPYFGYMRGAYSPGELKEVDQFASQFEVEIIPCIQTLGHLEQILRWPAFRDLKDTDDVLLVDEEKTYALIEKMIETWRNAVGSKRLHLGMDETHMMGRGRFYDLHGDEPHFDIFNRHLKKVAALSRKHGFRPMIWSDMYFRMGNRNNDYYDAKTVIPTEVVNAIPKKTDLVYWDYYHDSKEFYVEWIERHRALGGLPLMASGVWTGNKFWYDRHVTEKIVPPCVEACRQTGVEEVLFTLWGDDGVLGDLDSAIAGLAFAAEHVFSGQADPEVLNAKFCALFSSASYDEIRAVSKIERKGIFPASTLWDDPLMLIFLAEVKFRDMEADGAFFPETIRTCNDIAQALSMSKTRSGAGDLVLAKSLAEAVAAKLALADTLLTGYLENDRRTLAAVFPLIDQYARKLRRLTGSYRKMWLRNYKPFGLETMQIRFAGQQARLNELSLRLKEFLDGDCSSIPELEEIKKVKGLGSTWRYKNVSHGSVIL